MWYQNSQRVFFEKAVWSLETDLDFESAEWWPFVVRAPDQNGHPLCQKSSSMSFSTSWIFLVEAGITILRSLWKGERANQESLPRGYLHISHLFHSPQYPFASFRFLCLSPTNFSHTHLHTLICPPAFLSCDHLLLNCALCHFLPCKISFSAESSFFFTFVLFQVAGWVQFLLASNLASAYRIFPQSLLFLPPVPSYPIQHLCHL